MLIDLTVNGETYEVEAPPGRFLADLLRQDLGITDVKQACDEGECGSCTVLLDGLAVDSCIYLAAQCAGREVTTVGGLSRGEHLSSLQRVFATTGAVQCGFCTPGLIVAATALLEEQEHPTEKQIRAGLAGNLCRCTGYNGIVEAVARAAEGADHD
jgi:aerobic carbon-monoxide dehydrogenase small subunit